MTEQTADLTPEPIASPEAERVRTLEARIAEIEATSKARVIQAEMKTEAVKAGMIDLDGLKLADLSGVALDEAGGLVGGAAAIVALRRAKPWLFAAANSSSPALPPSAQPPRAKLATEMTHAEWQAARRDLMRRR